MMRVTKKMLDEQVAWLNKQVYSFNYKISFQLERYNGYVHLTDHGHNNIVVGTPKEVYEHIGTMRQLLWKLSD